MKFAILTVVGMWFAFVTVAKSFHALDAMLRPNDFNSVSIAIVALFTMLIGLGYTVFLHSLLDSKLPRAETITITLFCGVLVLFLVALQRLFQVGLQWSDPLQVYVRVDAYLRDRHHTVITWMDFGNTLLLSLTTLWWTLTGAVLLLLHQTRRRKV